MHIVPAISTHGILDSNFISFTVLNARVQWLLSIVQLSKGDDIELLRPALQDHV